MKAGKMTLTGHLRKTRFCLRGAYGSRCQNFDGWACAYGSTYGALTEAYGTTVKATCAKPDFTPTYGGTYETLTGAYGAAV